MPIQSGSVLPSIKINLKGVDVDIQEHFKTNTGVIFGVPGAFSPVCTETHLPGFRDRAKEFKSKINFLGCLAVNDPYVIKAWAKHCHVHDQLTFVADVDGTLTKALDLMHEFHDVNLGWRCRRFAIVIAPGARVHWIGFDEDAYADRVLVKVNEMLETQAPAASTRWDYAKQGADWLVDPTGHCSPYKHQSPINLETAEATATPAASRKSQQQQSVAFRFGSAPSSYSIILVGHVFDIVAKSTTQHDTITWNGTTYTFDRFRMHGPSEHTVDNKRADLEIQLLYHTTDRDRLIVSVLADISADSDPNEFLKPVLTAANSGNPQDKQISPSVTFSHGLAGLVPALLGRTDSANEENAASNSGDGRDIPLSKFFTYTGSLTVPPCSGPVVWFICKTNAKVDRSQVEALGEYLQQFGSGTGNYRLTQQNDAAVSVVDGVLKSNSS